MRFGRERFVVVIFKSRKSMDSHMDNKQEYNNPLPFHDMVVLVGPQLQL
jgi:hypothetical protein